MDKRGGVEGYHDFLSKILCHTVPKKIAEEIYSVLIISSMEKTLLKRVMSRFSVDFIRLTVPKNFVEEPLIVSQNFRNRKNTWIREGE